MEQNDPLEDLHCKHERWKNIRHHHPAHQRHVLFHTTIRGPSATLTLHITLAHTLKTLAETETLSQCMTAATCKGVLQACHSTIPTLRNHFLENPAHGRHICSIRWLPTRSTR
jgi:hypothetical protein